MKKLTLVATLVLAPTALLAQASTQVGAKTSMGATSAAPAGNERKLSAEAQTAVDANIRVARERKLPEEPIRQRVAEGQAKGASDAQIAAASERTLLDLQNSFDAMVRGGRANPSGDEVARGAQLIARGYTSTQLEAVTKKAPLDQSLVGAFETLNTLNAQGTSTANAIAQLESSLANVGATGSAAVGVKAGVAGTVGGVLGKKP